MKDIFGYLNGFADEKALCAISPQHIADLPRTVARVLVATLLLTLIVGGISISNLEMATGLPKESSPIFSGKLADIEGHWMKLTETQDSNDLNGSEYALVIDNSGNVYRFQGGPLEFIEQATTQELRSIAWRPDGAYALIVGQGATVKKYDGVQFATINPDVPGNTNFQSVAWRQDGSFALISGSSGRILKYDGVSISTISSPSSDTIRSISWHPDRSSALLVGNDGEVLVYQNDSLVPLTSGVTSDLYSAAWNPSGQYALISGTNGTILKYDGSSFIPFDTSNLYNATHIVRSVAWDSTGSLALLVGDTGLVLSYDGVTMARLKYNGLPNVTNSNLYAVVWRNDSATIVGGKGDVFTFNGALQKLNSSVTTSLRGIGWTPPLTANFTLAPPVPIAGNPATFTASASGTPPYNFTWIFGDGTFFSANPAVHTYLLAGNFTVTLVVTDTKGLEIVVLQRVTVAPWAPSQFRLDWADYDNDGKVGIADVAHAAICFDKTSATSDWSSYDCAYWDIDIDNMISIVDVAWVAFKFDKALQSPFPGEGQSPGRMDPQWGSFVFLLDPADQLYWLAHS